MKKRVAKKILKKKDKLKYTDSQISKAEKRAAIKPEKSEK